LERKKRRKEAPSSRGRALKIDRVPIVALTAHTRESDRQKCLDAGMDDYMSKPIKPKELFQIVERLSKQATKEKEKQVPAAAAGVPPGKDVFDPLEALAVVAGKKELLQELAQIFLDNLPEYVANIRKGISKRDAGVLERSVHALKGAVANFGARRAYEAAYRLEQLGKRSKMDEAEYAMSVLDKELGALQESLRGYFKGVK
jgi:protein-histidine pros-kinase